MTSLVDESRRRLRILACTSRRFHSSAIVLVLTLVAGFNSTFAATVYWDSNGSTPGAGITPAGTWGADPFWNANSAGTLTTSAWTPGDVATFSAGTDATGSFTVTVAGNQSLSGLVFEEGIVSLSGGTLDFGGTTGLVMGSGSAVIDSVLAGTAGLTKTGSGTVTLTSVNIYTGSTLLSGGVTTLSGNGSIAAATGGVTLSNGAVLNLDNSGTSVPNRTAGPLTSNGGTFNFTPASTGTTESMDVLTVNPGKLTMNVNAPASGTGGLIFSSVVRNAGGTALFNGPGLGISPTNIITFTSAPVLSSGILPWAVVTDGTNTAFATYGANGVAANTVHQTGAQTTWTASTVNARPAADQTVTASRTLNSLTLDDGIDLLAPAADRTITMGAGTMGAVLQTGGSSVIAATGTFDNILAFSTREAIFHTMGDLAIRTGGTDNLTGSGGMTKDGAGTLTVSRNAITGVLSLNEGVYRADGTSTNAFGNGSVAFNGGSAQLAADANVSYARNVTVNQDAAITVDRLTAGAGVTHTLGTLSIGDRMLTLNAGPNVTVNTSYGLIFGNTIFTAAPIFNVANNGTGIGTLTIGTITNGGAFPITKTGAGDLVTNGTASFGGPIDVQAGRVGWSNNTTATIINEGSLISGAGGIIKSGASTVNLTATNTFTGNVTISGGVLGFETVTNIGGGPSNLGAGSAIVFGGSGALSFTGSISQSTDRSISTIAATANDPTLRANGTGGATITYNGPISLQGNTINLDGFGNGIINGAISNSGGGITADMNKNGTGTWTINTAPTIDDDIVVNDGTLVVNAANFHTGDDFFVRGPAVVRLGVNGALTTPAMDDLFIGDNNPVPAGTPTFDLNGTTGSSIDLIQIGSTQYVVAGQAATYSQAGALIDTGSGTGSISANSLDLRAGTLSGDVIMGTGTLTKQTAGTFTISSTITAGAGGTTITGGTLNLDYTIENTNKLNAAAGALTFQAGTLNIIGNASAPTTQSVSALTLSGQGHATLSIMPGTGQTATFDAGAITRANNTGNTITFNLPSDNAVVLTTSTNTTGILGGFATVRTPTGDYFATVTGGQIDALDSAAIIRPEVRDWAPTLVERNVSDGTAFVGTSDYMNVNSLRFAGSAPLVVEDTLNIVSGGLLVTPTSTASGISGGSLTVPSAKNYELIVTQNSVTDFNISSTIRRTDTNTGGFLDITKSGSGTLILSGVNYTGDRAVPFAGGGSVKINEGILAVSGGFAISDNSAVVLKNIPGATLKLLSNETIGNLSGGGTDGGTVDFGTNTLTVNLSTSQTFAGFFTGSGGLVKQNLGPAGAQANLNLNSNNTGFTGTAVVNGGMLQLSGNGISTLPNATAFTVNKGADLLIDNNGATTAAPGAGRIGDTAIITLNGANGTFSGQSAFRGLAIRNDQNGTRNETVGNVVLGSGASYMTNEATVGTAGLSELIMNNLTRAAGTTLSVRGTNLGSNTGQHAEVRIGTAANQTAFMTANLVGGGGAAGTTTISIVPWAIAQNLGAFGLTTTFGTALVQANLQLGNSLSTYVSGDGFRPLNFTNEYATLATANGLGTSNVRESLTTTDLTGIVSATVNALVLDNSDITTARNVTGAGAGAALNVTSGTLLFTALETASGNSLPTTTIAGYAGGGVAQGMTLGGFDGGITTTGAAAEYVIFQNNLSAAGVTISSPLTSAAKLTKSGLGTLILSGVNTAINDATLNEGIVAITDNDNIGGDTGALTFGGGTLRLTTGYTDDLSTRSIVVLGTADGVGGNNGGWGRLDTNGVSTTFAAGNISGAGEFVKAGAGTLTLAATTATTHTGTFVVEQTGSGTATPAIAQLVLNNSGGNAIGGNLQIGAYVLPAANGTAVVQLGRSGQIVDSAIVSFNGAASKSAILKLMGFDETVSGIQDTSANGIIEVVEAEGGTGAASLSSTLTVNNTSDNYFNGTLRARAGGTNDGRLNFIKGAAGTQTLAGTGITYGDALSATIPGGQTTITEGTLRMRDTTSFGDATTGTNGGISISGGAALDLERTNTTAWTLRSVISGAGDVIKTGAGTGATSLLAANTLTGSVQVNAGVIGLGTTGSINDARAMEVNPGATFDTGRTAAASYSYDGVVAGSGTIAGNLTLTNVSIGAVVGIASLRPGQSSDTAANATTGDLLGSLAFTGSLTMTTGSNALLQIEKPTLNDAAGISAALSGGTLNSYLAAQAPAWNAAPTTDAEGVPLHDSVNVTGTLTWNTGSTFIYSAYNGYVPMMGDVLDLLDWGTLAGTYNLGDSGTGRRSGGLIGDFDLPVLSPDLSYDVTLFASTGIVVVVPEPGRTSLMVLAPAALLLGRRRQARQRKGLQFQLHSLSC